jgi:hypothetical protein
VFGTLRKIGGLKKRKILGARQGTTLGPLFLLYNIVFPIAAISFLAYDMAEQ